MDKVTRTIQELETETGRLRAQVKNHRCDDDECYCYKNGWRHGSGNLLEKEPVKTPAPAPDINAGHV